MARTAGWGQMVGPLAIPVGGVVFVMRGRWRWLATGIAAVTVAASVIVWTVWPSGSAPRARQYSAFTACLLTDSRGVAGPAAVPVWAGMQEASLQTRAKVQFLSVAGEATKEDALPYLASLVRRRCDVVLAVGVGPVAAVAQEAALFQAVRFVVVGGDIRGSNVTGIATGSPDETRSRVKAAVVSAVAGSSRG